MKCLFTDDVLSRFAPYADFAGLYSADCQTCGEYLFTSRAQQFLQSDADIHLKTICASESIRAQKRGEIVLWKVNENGRVDKDFKESIVQKDVDSLADYSINHADKIEAILNQIADKSGTTTPFHDVKITYQDCLSIRCSDMDEYCEWAGVLLESGFIESYDIKIRTGTMGSFGTTKPVSVQLTPRGWLEVVKFRGSNNSKKVFIAMAFRGNEERPQIQQAIEKACREVGFEAETVDGTEFLGRINDQIIAMINGAKFIIAEFTLNNPGVYYEAGYAQGRGLHVIYTVKKSDLEKLHFDTNQINHIVWEDYSDLEERIKTRIKAVIL